MRKFVRLPVVCRHTGVKSEYAFNVDHIVRLAPEGDDKTLIVPRDINDAVVTPLPMGVVVALFNGEMPG